MPRSARTVVIIWAVAVCAIRLLQAPLAALGNNALFLYSGGLLLDGRLPYRDWWELNPPLITYLSAIPVFLARVFHTHPIPVFTVVVIAAAAWSAIVTVGMIRRLEPQARSFDAMALAFVLLLPALTWPTSHGTAFGERDHLFTLFYTPYFAIRLARWRGAAITRHGTAFGVLAGVGTLLKPQFAAIAIGMELYWLIKYRRARPLVAPETIAAAAAAVAYLAHFAAIPSVGRGFFSVLLPEVLRGYSAFDAPRSELLQSAGMALVRALPMFGVLAVAARFSPLRRLAGSLICLYVLGNAAYLQHGKMWPYTYHVARQAEVLLAAVACSGVWHWLLARAYAWPRRGFATTLGALALVFAAFHANAPNDDADAAALLRSETRPGQPVLVLATTGAAAYPTIVQQNLHQGSRYLWPFPAVLTHADEIRHQSGPIHVAGPRSAFERQFLSVLAEDVRRSQPAVVLIQEEPACERCEGRFTLAQYFRETRVLEEILAADYSPPFSAAGFRVYRRRR